MRVLDDLWRTAALGKATAEDIVRRMREPERFYHGLGHLTVLWSRHRRYAPGTEYGAAAANRLIACAVALHDAIYDSTRSDNEECSAALWRQCAPVDLAAEDVDWVADTIAATMDHLAVHDASSQPARLRLWMMDLDLTPLGERPAVFDRNTTALRKEFAHLSDDAWEARRVGFMRHLLAAPRIFRCEPLAAAFEQQARENIERSLQA